jgi:hypothetical protein
MSIFKSTFSKTISSQLKAREKVISNPNSRDSTFLQFSTLNNSWVRMTSFVNYDDPKGRYKGNELSQKYILEGGTLYNKGGNKGTLRSGVNKPDGIYGSNLDKISFNPSDPKINRAFGIRPMPGITSVNVMNKSAYGSLREATIQFYCWDKHQLEELELLFMRTGYTVFLEWGWSQYLNHSIAEVNTNPDNIVIKNFDTQTLDPFKPGLSEDGIYNKIDNDINKSLGNYDALLGYIQNFSWQLLPNGGFQCSTTLISRGEVLSGLKVSSNNNIILGSQQTEVSTTTTDSEEPKPIVSLFEKIFLNIIGHANESEFVQKFGYGNQGTTTTTGSFYIEGSNDDQRKALRDQADQVYNDVKEKLLGSTYKSIVGDWNNYYVASQGDIDLDNDVVVKFCDGQTEGTAIEYISMDAFIAILNEFFIIKDKKTKQPAVCIIIPKKTPCLASEDSVSIDPTSCLIKNSKATFITDDETNGFSPEVYKTVNVSSLSDEGTSEIGSLPDFIAGGTTNIGYIGNIYISINKLIQIYRGLYNGPDGVNILDYLQEVLDNCSFSLGGINDFKLFSTKNTVQIIDAKYFETGADSKVSSKFKFDLFGLKSICRDVKINSRIFSEQSTMIGIGATSGNVANLGDVYTSTQNYFNKGLTDRVLTTTFDDTPNSEYPVGNVILTPDEYYRYTVYKNVEQLTSYVNRNVLGLPEGSQQFKVTRLPQSNDVINAGSLLKTFHYQINGKDVNFKALIPFELEMTLDGISGLVIGQIFVIDKSILPKDYQNKNLGFIITGISNSLQNNDWATTIKTQVCLLENDEIKNKYGIDKTILKELIKETRKAATKNGYFMCALVDYMVQLTILSNENKDGDKLLYMSYLNDPSTLADDEDIVKKLTSFQINFNKIEQFLKNWYKQASTLSLKDFPKTYEEFIEPDNITKSGPLKDKLIAFAKTLKNDNLSYINNLNSDSYNKASQEQQKKIREGALNSTFIGKILYSQNKSANIIFSNLGIKNVKTPIDLINTDSNSYIFINKSYSLAAQLGDRIPKDGLKSLFLIYLNYIRQYKTEFGVGAFDIPTKFNPENLINPK